MDAHALAAAAAATAADEAALQLRAADVQFYLRTPPRASGAAAAPAPWRKGPLAWDTLLRCASVNEHATPGVLLSLHEERDDDDDDDDDDCSAAPALLAALRGEVPLPGLSARAPACVGDLLPQARVVCAAACTALCATLR
jgi:hypothetical protein